MFLQVFLKTNYRPILFWALGLAFFAFFGYSMPADSGTIAILILLLVIATSAFVFPRLKPILIMAPVVAAFVLLNRIDEGLALHFGDTTVKVTYWFAAIVLGGLFLCAALNKTLRPGLAAPKNPFISWYFFLLCVFLALGSCSIIVNALFDKNIPVRSCRQEFFALGLVGVPALFPIAIALSDLTRQQVINCLRLLVALGAGSGLVMMLFAIFPNQVVGLLGWSKELGGGGGLVRGSMPLGHPNTVSGILMLLLPIAITRGTERRSLFWTPFQLGSSLLMFAGILFSLSRSTLVITVPIVLACAFYLMKTREIGKYVTWLILSFWVIVLIGGVVFLFSRYDFSRFWSREYYEDASVTRRAQTMSTAFHIFLDYPVLGSGPAAVYPRDDLVPDWIPDQVDAMGEIIFYKGLITSRNGHNIYLHALAEYGLLGAAAFAALLASVFAAMWRGRADTKTAPPLARGTVVGFLLAFVGFLGLGMGAVFFLYSLRVGLVFWSLFGLAIHYCGLVARENQV